MPHLTERYDRAVAYARVAHKQQLRKGGEIPYLYHLLGVSSLVLEFGGDEDQAIAGLLHDVLEDCGAHHEATIRADFGDRVADIVKACTDGTQQSKAAKPAAADKYRGWLQRKLAYIGHLHHANGDALLVSGCDKLHNARAILQDLRDPMVGMAVFARFTGAVDGTLRYYYSLARTMEKRKAPMAGELSQTVESIHALADTRERLELDHGVYHLRIYDNFHYQDETETYTTGPWIGAEEALTEARHVVRRAVADHCSFDHYVAFGDDPVIIGTPPVNFSARSYARELIDAAR